MQIWSATSSQQETKDSPAVRQLEVGQAILVLETPGTSPVRKATVATPVIRAEWAARRRAAVAAWARATRDRDSPIVHAAWRAPHRKNSRTSAPTFAIARAR